MMTLISCLPSSNSQYRPAAQLCSECPPVHQRGGGFARRADPRQHGTREQARAWGVHLV
jgi:hypothetical protein